jgi:thiamine pyrophosphate-dependent acetolactate synthase large subunit-like protein
MLNREQLLNQLRGKLRDDDVVVTSLASPSRAWKQQDAAQLSYGISDPMGMGPSFALGLAYALQADKRRVILLEGDGDLLMNLGALAMLANANPPNLKVLVLQNGCYETTGGQSTPNGFEVDFAEISRGCGFSPTRTPTPTPTSARTIDSPADLEPALNDLLERDGLGLLAVRVETSWQPYGAAPEWSIAEERLQFQLRLRAERAASAGQL